MNKKYKKDLKKGRVALSTVPWCFVDAFCYTLRLIFISKEGQ